MSTRSDNTVFVNNILSAGGSLRAPIFLDTNYTGYYVDPNSSSQLWAVFADDWFRAQGCTGFYFQTYARGLWSPECEGNPYGTVTTNGSGRNGWLGYGIGSRYTLMSTMGDNVGMHDSARGWVWLMSGAILYLYYAGSERMSMQPYGVFVNNDIRSPIFYDHDTSFYFDGNGTTRWNGVDTFSKMRIGLTARNNNRRNEFTGDSNYWVGTMGWGTTDFISAFDWGSGFIDTWGSIPNSPGDTSHYVGLQASHYNAGYNTGYGVQLVGGPIQGLWHTSYWPNKRSWYKLAMYNLNESSATFWSTIMYDSNDGSYYIDPNGRSRLAAIETTGGAYNLFRSWTDFTGHHGVYSSVHNNAHFYPNPSSYGAWQIIGNRNGWGGIEFQSGVGNVSLMVLTNSNATGFHNNSYGWQLEWTGGGLYIGRNTYGGNSTRALQENTWIGSKYFGSDGAVYGTIFYDANDSFYVVDPTGTTRLWYTEIRSLLSTFGIGGRIDIAPNQGSFGGYIRSDRHLVIETVVPGHHTYVLDVGTGVGVVRLYGNQFWQAHSDRTLKTVHSNITNVLEKLETITPVYYSFNNVENDKNRIGLIAQEVQIHYPELVDIEPMHDKLVLDYTGMIPVLLAAIKELKAELDIVKEELNTLKNK